MREKKESGRREMCRRKIFLLVDRGCGRCRDIRGLRRPPPQGARPLGARPPAGKKNRDVVRPGRRASAGKKKKGKKKKIAGEGHQRRVARTIIQSRTESRARIGQFREAAARHRAKTIPKSNSSSNRGSERDRPSWAPALVAWEGQKSRFAFKSEQPHAMPLSIIEGGKSLKSEAIVCRGSEKGGGPIAPAKKSPILPPNSRAQDPPGSLIRERW